MPCVVSPMCMAEHLIAHGMPWGNISSRRRATLLQSRNSSGINSQPTPCNTPASPRRNSKGSWMRDEHAPPPLTRLTEEEGAAALVRYRLIQPSLEQGVPLAQVAKHHGDRKSTRLHSSH